MTETIFTEDGRKYITLHYDSGKNNVRMQLHNYEPQEIFVSFDGKAIPKIIEFLELARSK
jgi:hypothetical protein